MDGSNDESRAQFFSLDTNKWAHETTLLPNANAPSAAEGLVLGVARDYYIGAKPHDTLASFAELDLNDDGIVTESEFARVQARSASGAGSSVQRPPNTKMLQQREAIAKLYVRLMDKDRDLTVSRSEYDHFTLPAYAL